MATCYDRYRNRYYTCNSRWNDWGRWVVLGIIILAAFFFFFFCSCMSARRRRKAGRNPFYGTGWAGRVPVGHGQAQYNPSYGQQQQPQYNQQQQYQSQPPNYNQTGHGQNQGYFGGQQTEVEMQRPNNTYRGGEDVYAPPPGPPPTKQ